MIIYHPTGKPTQRLQLDPAGIMVGASHDDHCRLRGHGTEDLCRHVRGRFVRPGRRAHDRLTRAGHREQLCDVLLAHAGAR